MFERRMRFLIVSVRKLSGEKIVRKASSADYMSRVSPIRENVWQNRASSFNDSREQLRCESLADTKRR